MFRLDILSDEYLMESLDTVISGMLPHENFDPKLLGSILIGTLNYIHLEELEMEYFVVFSVLTQLRKLQIEVKDYIPKLTREVLASTVESNIYDIVRKPSVRIRDWLLREGHPDNLEIETTLEIAVQQLYSRTMELYDRCFEKAVSSEDAVSSLTALKNHFITNVSESSLSVQRDILQNGVRQGRKFYSGSDGWLQYISELRVKLQQRLSESDKGTFHIDSIEKVDELFIEHQQLGEEIGEHRMPPLDMSVKMLKHRLRVIAANEGVGKTTLAVDDTGYLLSKGRRVVFMCGESPRSLIFSRILSNYIYHTRKLFVTADHIAGRLETTEEIDRVIKLAAIEIQESGNLILQDSFSYYTVYDELVSLYEELEFDAVFIDHSKALKGGRKEKEDLDSLAVQLREFKRNYPVHVCVLSHLSSMAKEIMAKGKRVENSPTRGSSTLSGEADEVLVLSRTATMKEQGLVAVEVYKIRSTAVNDLIILTLKPSISSFEFDPRNQQAFDRSVVGAEVALQQIEELHDEDDDDFIDLDD